MSLYIVLAHPEDGEGKTPSVNNDRRWVGLQGPQVRIVWMKSDVPATRIMRSARAHPIVRCGSGTLGDSNRTAPKPIAAKAKAHETG
jgi:hypothetical protein